MTDDSEEQSDEPEKTYQERVVDYLIEHYGEDNVEDNEYLSETSRYADVWVEGPVLTLAIEIENDFEAVFKGVGQTIVYAAHSDEAVPVIIIPPGHTEEPEASMIRSRIPLIELDV